MTCGQKICRTSAPGAAGASLLLNPSRLASFEPPVSGVSKLPRCPPQPASPNTNGARMDFARWIGTGRHIEFRPISRQGIEAYLKPGHGERYADSFFRGLKNDEGGLLASFHLVDQFVLHDHLGYASGRKTADETGASDIGVVDFKPQSGGKKHPKRCNDPQKSALPIRCLEDDDRQIDVWLVFRDDALQERALLLGGARWRLAAQLPIAMLGFHDALANSARPARQEPNTSERQSEKAPRARCFDWSDPPRHGVSCLIKTFEPLPARFMLGYWP